LEKYQLWFGLICLFERMFFLLLSINTNELERKEFLDLIEQEYMDEMDPEGWYGFKRAMEKDD